MTTTELSTSMPMPSAKPDRLRILKVMPVKYIITMANSTLSGIEMATTSVGRRSFRNSASTRMASMAPSPRLLTIMRM